MQIKVSVFLVTCCLGGCLAALVGGCENLGDLTGGSKSSSEAEALPAVTNTDAVASSEARPKPTVAWVDDDYTPRTSGWGYDHFDNINEAVRAVAPHGLVNIQDGSYPGTDTMAFGDVDISAYGTGSVYMAREHTGTEPQ